MTDELPADRPPSFAALRRLMRGVDMLIAANPDPEQRARYQARFRDNPLWADTASLADEDAERLIGQLWKLGGEEPKP